MDYRAFGKNGTLVTKNRGPWNPQNRIGPALACLVRGTVPRAEPLSPSQPGADSTPTAVQGRGSVGWRLRGDRWSPPARWRGGAGMSGLVTKLLHRRVEVATVPEVCQGCAVES